MDFSHILHTSIPQQKKLLQYGFTEQDSEYVLKQNLVCADFYVLIIIREDKISAEVFENFSDEKYALFDVAAAQGAFVGKIREEVDKIIEDIREKCFDITDVKQKYCDFLINHFGIRPDFPWNDTPDYSVYRCKNNKWFALIMKIKFRQLGFQSDEPVWVVNMKADSSKIPDLVDKKSIFPAYHMNKKYWITILLTSVTSFEKLCQLTEKSYCLVEGKK